MKSFVEHVAVMVSDIDWHIDFFTNACGMKITRRQESNGAVKQIWLQGGIQLVKAKPGEVIHNFHHIGLVVSDFNIARKIMLSYAEVKPLEGKPEKWLQLPDGIVLELFQEKPDALQKVLDIEIK